MRRQCLTGPRIVAAITQSVCGVAVGLLRGVAEVAFHCCTVALVGFFLVPVSAAVASGFVVAGVGVVCDTIVTVAELFTGGSTHRHPRSRNRASLPAPTLP